jgi:hypothetical protein
MADKHDKAAPKAETPKPVETPVTPSPVDTPAVYQTTEDGSVQHQPPSSPQARPSPSVSDGSVPPPVEVPPENPEAEQAQREARFRSSRGAQVILDPESDASLAARGAAAGTIEANVVARDADLQQKGLDPRDPDATHLPANRVPAGGAVMDKVGVDKVREASFQPPEADASVKKA